MVKTELNIVEDNLTRDSGVDLNGSIEEAGGVNPSVLPSISKFLSTQDAKMFATDGVSF